METAKRFAIFALLGPPLAHFVAFAMWLASMAAVEGAPLIPTQLPLLLKYTMWSLWFAYLLGIIPSLLIGGLDFLLRKNRLRIGWTTLAGASASFIALRIPDLDPRLGWWALLVMAVVGAVPAAICSWLSGPAAGIKPAE